MHERLTMRKQSGTAVFDMPQAHQTLDQLFTQQDFDSCNFTISRNWANYTDTSFEVILLYLIILIEVLLLYLIILIEVHLH
jgi:hypothetical protein